MLRLEVYNYIYIYTPELSQISQQTNPVDLFFDFFPISVVYFFIFFFYHHYLDSCHLMSGKLNNILSYTSLNIHSVLGWSINLLKSWFAASSSSSHFSALTFFIAFKLAPNTLKLTPLFPESLPQFDLKLQILYTPSCLCDCAHVTVLRCLNLFLLHPPNILNLALKAHIFLGDHQFIPLQF